MSEQSDKRTWSKVADAAIRGAIGLAVAWLLNTLWRAVAPIIPRTALVYALTALFFLPVVALLAWVYETCFLERIGKTSILWRMTVIPLVAVVMTGIILAGVILTCDEPPVTYFRLSKPEVRLQVTTYSTNGLSSFQKHGDSLLITFSRYWSSEPLSGMVVEVPFEAGVILGTGARSDIDLSRYQVVAYKLLVDNTERVPCIGLGIKDAGLYEMKYLPVDSAIARNDGWFEVPLDPFLGLSLRRVDALVLFTRDLQPGQSFTFELKELGCE